MLLALLVLVVLVVIVVAVMRLSKHSSDKRKTRIGMSGSHESMGYEGKRNKGSGFGFDYMMDDGEDEYEMGGVG